MPHPNAHSLSFAFRERNFTIEKDAIFRSIPKGAERRMGRKLISRFQNVFLRMHAPNRFSNSFQIVKRPRGCPTPRRISLSKEEISMCGCTFPNCDPPIAVSNLRYGRDRKFLVWQRSRCYKRRTCANCKGQRKSKEVKKACHP
jgi:hypothetical protein